MEMIQAIGLYLSYSKHDGHSGYMTRSSSHLVVVSAGYETAANVLEDRLSVEGAWEKIFAWLEEAGQPESCGGRTDRTKVLISLLESCSALKEGHSLHFSNLVATLTQHAVMQIEKVGQQETLHSNCGYLLDKICSRGFSEWVVRTLLRLHETCSHKTETFQSILENFPETGHGTKAFVTELLNQVSLLSGNVNKGMLMKIFVPSTVWNKNIVIQLQLGDVLLTKGNLRKESLDLLVDYLNLLRSDSSIMEDPIMSSLERAVMTWSGHESPNRLTLYQQKVLANFIIKSLGLVSKSELEMQQSIITNLLKGISTYLGSPRDNLRQLGMCVGNALSGILSPDNPPVFVEEGIEKCISLEKKHSDVIKNKVIRQNVIVEDRNAEFIEPDSDDETDSEFGNPDNLDELDEQEPEKLIQLQELVKLLSSTEDRWKDQLDAIALSATLIQASPCELDLYVEPLARGLMYCSIPHWANQEREKDSGKCFEEQRMDALLELVVVSPEKAGICLIDVFYASSSNIEHRAKALQILSTGSKTISTRYLSSTSGVGPKTPQIYEKINFPRVLLDWSAKLLMRCDKQQHGIDLFGKDSYLLGCLLCTLGNFMEILSGTQEALYLATAVLKLALSDSVRNNKEVFVRRSALAATAQSISSVPASSICVGVADILIGIENGPLASQHVSLTAKEFISLMNRVNSWLKNIQENDIDSTCKKLGHGGVKLIELLTMDALDEYSKQCRQLDSTSNDLQIKSLEHLKSHEQSISIRIPEIQIVKPHREAL